VWEWRLKLFDTPALCVFFADAYKGAEQLRSFFNQKTPSLFRVGVFCIPSSEIEHLA